MYVRALNIREAYYRAHGSPFVPLFAAAAKALGSKPVMLGFAMIELQALTTSAGAGKSANWWLGHVKLTMRASLCGYVETQRDLKTVVAGLTSRLLERHAPRRQELGHATPAPALICIVPSAFYHISVRPERHIIPKLRFARIFAQQPSATAKSRSTTPSSPATACL
jgi:hypothetical protein